MAEVLLLNGPNLGRLGTREPRIYGHTSLAQVVAEVTAVLAGVAEAHAEQHDAEAGLIDALHRHRNGAAAIVNPGALMMQGFALREALRSYGPMWIEVHISNIHAREEFRHQSILAPFSDGLVAGLGVVGYVHAARLIRQRLVSSGRPP